jgi:ketosteroid isomerase-like protein
MPENGRNEMKKSGSGAALLLLLGTLVSPACSGLENKSEGGVAAVLDQYIKAFRSRDRELVARVYAHDDELVVFGSSPADRRVGWDATRQYVERYFAAVDSIEIALKERWIKVHRSGEAAWFSQVLDWKERAGKEVAQIPGLRISGVLEKRNDLWVIVQLHASGPPAVVSALP